MRPIRYSVFVILVLCFLGLQSMIAQWATDPSVNNAVCRAANGQSSPVIVPDGTGGAIIAWQDYRSGINVDIYAGHINASGQTLWATDGVPVCTAAGDQMSPGIIGDGTGGAIITWYDSRNGSNDIYAQRISSSGAARWTANGVPVCTAAGEQMYPVLTGDGTGGAIITWHDSRNGNNDIYAQRITSGGTVQWTANGVPISIAAADQITPAIVGDGMGGAIITWSDSQNGNADIYAQRIDSGGVVQWTANGVAICTAAGDQVNQKITTDGSGGAVITWQDLRGSSWDIYAQRINPLGIVQWTANGVAVCGVPAVQGSPAIVSDGTGGAIISWLDQRSGADNDILAQHVNAAGSLQWAAGGIGICVASYEQDSQTMVEDGTGGAIITWQDFRSGNKYDIYAQRVTGSGGVQWGANGLVVSNAVNHQNTPVIASDGTGGAIIAWPDMRFGSDNIYAQRVDRRGALYPAPWITRTGDVGSDQGGQLRVLWNPSKLDSWPDTSVSSYVVKIGVRSTGVLAKSSAAAANGIYWQTAATVPADWSSGYSVLVRTAADSGLQGVPWYYFQVIAKSSDELTFWTSNIDSGYSQDNIPPVGISGERIAALGNGRIALRWNTDRIDPDLMGYRIYRSTASGFVPNESAALATAFDSTFVDSLTSGGSHYYYRIAGIDVHGNTGTPSAEVNAIAVGIDSKSTKDVPASFALGQNYPNPFNPATTISFDLPARSFVSLKIFDPLGREVATVVSGEMSAGRYARQWNAAGLSSGIYFYRLQAGAFHETRKLLLLK